MATTEAVPRVGRQNQSGRMTERVREILSWYESDSPGTKTNIARLLNSGYLAGSAWAEYRASADHSACGVRLPPGLRESDRLPEPIFTPATKAASGHDENIPFAVLADRLGADLAARLRDASLALYRAAATRAEARGILLADTKFEFGLRDGRLLLIDEALTPDSSRFWDAARYAPGQPQASYDKQYVRDWLLTSGWNREPPAPELPPDIVEKTSQRYHEAYRRLTGRELMRF